MRTQQLHPTARRSRRARHAAHIVPVAAMPRVAHASFGYRAAQLPAGSILRGPIERGDQGISSSERPHAERAITRLFEAGGVDMIASYDASKQTYELRSRTGLVRWQRWATPSGELRYVVVEQRGDNPIPNVDGTLLRTFEEETAAAGGVGRPVPKERNSYPDMLGRLAQLFDSARAPDFVYIPGPGGDPNHPGAGSHGIPDIVQSRSPLVIAGPGIRAGAVSERLTRHEDIAPTVAQLIGVKPTLGTNASGVTRLQHLKWQDGGSFASALVDATGGAQPYNVAERAVVIVVDGMSQTMLLDEVAKGNVPNMAKLMRRGTTFANGSLAQYPVVTWANHNTLVTGAAPGHSGIVNNSWFNRETQTEQLITDGGFKNTLRTGKLISPHVETLYEAVERSFPDAETVAVNQPSGRGADVSVLDLEGIGSLFAHIGSIGLGFVRGLFGSIDRSMQSDKEYRATSLQDNAAAAIGEAYWSKKRPPKLGVFEFTLVDNQAHIKGPHHPDARTALREVDRQVGRVLKAIEDRGLMGSTAIVLTADHGMEHQSRNPKELGGWFDALKRAAADGAKTVESTRFVYVKSVRVEVVSAPPRLGARSRLQLVVRNDDANALGARPPVAGASVVVTDADGNSWRTTTDTHGRISLDVTPRRGPLRVVVEHADFSREILKLDVI